MMYEVVFYKYELGNPAHAGAYSALCDAFRLAGRALQFSNSKPKKMAYQNLTDCKYYRLDETTFEPVLDWCEFASTEDVRAGYWLKLPAGAIPCVRPIGAPARPAWLIASPAKGATASPLQLAVEWHHAAGGAVSQAEACRLFGASQSNFKITRQRMIARGALRVDK